MEKVNTISWIQDSRYGGVSWSKGSKVKYGINVIASSINTETELTITYSELGNQLKEHFSIQASDEAAVQQHRNHLTTLNSFMVFCGKNADSNVGTELGSGFDEVRQNYLKALSLSSRTKKDRSSHLKLIKSLAKALQLPPSKRAVKPISLSAALRVALANIGSPLKEFAQEVGVDPTTLSRWLHGASLNRRGYPSLRRLEKALGMERDYLVNLVKPVKVSESQDVQLPEFRQRIASQTSPALILAESELSESFKKEWWGLFTYKVGGTPKLKRQAKGQWRLISQQVAGRYSDLAIRRNMVCPTADIVSRRLRAFLGVLINLPVAEGGIGLGESPKQTLAWFAVPETLSTYLDWYTDRSSGIKHNGHRVFARTVASLLRPQTGYLWQQPEMRMALPDGFRPDSDDAWRKSCEVGHDYLRAYLRGAKGISRKPSEPIAHLLNSGQPLKPLFDLIDTLDCAAKEAVPGSLQEARCKRNALLVALLLSNPLRERTIASLTWTPEGTGSIRGSSSNGWRIVLSSSQLKNGESKGAEGYDVRIAEWVKPRLEAYVEEYRDVLLRNRESPYFFVGSESGQIWEGVSETIYKLSKRHIPGSPGFGAHAVRHLVATDWLRNNPGDFLTVAKVLNDRIETVIENYAHLSRDDSFIRYEAFLETKRSSA